MATKVLPPWVISVFFYIGMVSATLIRLIIFLNRVDLTLARIAWYLGVVGYIMFFGFRYYISRKRRRTIEQSNLLEKIQESNMDAAAKSDVTYLLESLIKSREIVNYMYIFVTSGIAIVVDMVLTVLLSA